MPSHTKICKKLLHKILYSYEDIASLNLPIQQQIDLIKKSNHISWYFVSFNWILPEAFIREFQDKVWWSSISEKQKLSENFIEEFQDRVYWHNIVRYQKLSEDFIKKFKNKMSWHLITQYQNVSTNFLNENRFSPIYLSARRTNVSTFNLPDVLTVYPQQWSTIDGYCIY